MVAAGLNPRMTVAHTIWRRVATHEAWERMPAFNRRSATDHTDSAANRGSKPTATFIPSLRDDGRIRFMARLHSLPRAYCGQEPARSLLEILLLLLLLILLLLLLSAF